MTLTLHKTATFRILPRACLSILLGLTFGLSSAGASATENLQVKNEIINLMLCYGKGTDTFGQPGNPDAYYDGLDIYEGCFTEDAIFNLWPAGTNFNSAPLLTIVGPESWAQNIVNPGVPRDPVTGLSISHGQHLLSNFMVETKGKTGVLTAYLNSTRTTFDGDSGAVTNVVVANGTYTLYVEKIRGKWLVNQLDLKLISAVNHFSAD